MSKTDAERAMNIYRTFTRQTDFVVQYLSIARQFEHHTRVEVPKLKHAPVNLGRQLEEYLKDPDFEIHRRQYLAELEAKKSKGGSLGASLGASKVVRMETASKSDTAKAFSSTNGPQAAKPAPTTKGPDADLIDFFESIELNQTPMAVQTQAQAQPQPQPQTQVQMGMSPWGPAPFQVQPSQPFQPNGFIAQPTGFQTDPFVQQQAMANYAQQQQQPAPQMQPAFTGAGLGAFSPQSSFQPSSLAPIPQESVASFQTGATPGFQGGLLSPQQTTNPFRQSILQQQTGSPFAAASPTASASPLQRSNTQSTNPFARSSPQAAQPFTTPNSSSPFQSQSPVQQQQQQQQQQLPTAPAPAPTLLPAPTGTNPFAKNFAPAPPLQPVPQQPQQVQGLISQPTGTNPFRQGAFVNHTTGLGWQHTQQPMGGLDQVETIPVFPRPAAQTPWQQ